MTDWSKPTTADTYTNYTTYLINRDASLAVGMDSALVSDTNVLTNTVRWNSTNKNWERWNGAAWGALAATYGISISGSAATLTTPRNIDGQSFNGSADITVIAPGTHAATTKTTPVGADELSLVDSAAAWVLKKVTLTNLAAYLATVCSAGWNALTATTATTATNQSGGSCSPNQLTGIIGTTTNNNANAGSVGEFIESILLQGSAVALTSTVSANITSITLTAGDWDVFGYVGFLLAGTTTVTSGLGGVSTTSATLPTTEYGGFNNASYTPGAVRISFSVPMGRVSLSGGATIYLVAALQFGTSTAGGFGSIHARRRR